MAKILNFALIGAGRIGKVHAACLAANPQCRLMTVTDIHQPSAEALAQRYQSQVRDLDAVFADETIDAVLIASATDTHADYIELAAKAGKAIFCEKPVDLSADRVKACLDVVNTHKARLFVGFNRRFDSSFSRVQQAIADGSIGNLEQIVITSRDPSPPPVEYIKVSGGLFRDMMIHDLDMATWLLAAVDDKPAQVFAYGENFVNNAIGTVGDIDTAMVLIRSQQGRQVHINNSRRATYGYDQRLEVHGSNGMAQAGNEPLTTTVIADADGYSGDVVKPFFLERYAAAYRHELNAFITAIAENKPLPVCGEDGYRSLLLADAALQSLQSNQAVAVDF